MTPQEREVMQMALEALTIFREWELGQDYNSNRDTVLQRAFKAEEALRAALAQPEREPVAYKVTSKLGEYCGFKSSSVKKGDLVYTATPQREWQGLTDEEMSDLIWKSDWEPQKIARAIEAASKEKNYGTL